MLFLVTHCHTPELCPVDNAAQVEATIKQMAKPGHAKDSGVKVLGSYIAPPEHVLYFVLEANDYGQVVRFFHPLMKMGTPRITLVQTLEESLGILAK